MGEWREEAFTLASTPLWVEIGELFSRLVVPFRTWPWRLGLLARALDLCPRRKSSDVFESGVFALHSSAGLRNLGSTLTWAGARLWPVAQLTRCALGQIRFIRAWTRRRRSLWRASSSTPATTWTPSRRCTERASARRARCCRPATCATLRRPGIQRLCLCVLFHLPSPCAVCEHAHARAASCDNASSHAPAPKNK